jgi:hypothetical protein
MVNIERLLEIYIYELHILLLNKVEIFVVKPILLSKTV